MAKQFFIFILLIIALSNAQRGGQKFVKNSNGKFCKRSIKATGSGKTRTITATSACGNQKKTGRAAQIQFTISSAILPFFQMKLKTYKQNQKGGKGKFFIVKLGFDQLLAYKEASASSGLGYQAGNDTVLARYYLDEFRNGRAKWSSIQRESIDIGDNKKVHTLFMDLAKGYPNIDNIEFGIDISPEEVTVEGKNKTRTKTVLTPNSFKLNLNITGIKNLPAGTSGIAIGAYLMVKGGVRKSTGITKPTNGRERVDQATKDQGVLNVASDDDAKADGAFFSWKKFVDAVRKGRSGTQEVQMIASDAKTLTSGVRNGINVEAGYVLKRIWFTIPDPDITSFVWDPSLGAVEAAVSSQLRMSFNFVLLILSVFCSVILY